VDEGAFLVGRASRDKGGRGELEVAAIFRTAGFDCDRVPNSGGLRLKGDLYGDIPVHVEVKRAERLKIPEWLSQARDEAPEGVTPVLAFRRSREAWYACMPLEALVALLSIARMVEEAPSGWTPSSRVMRDAIALHEARQAPGK
jgi:Holliday junction resolvase